MANVFFIMAIVFSMYSDKLNLISTSTYFFLLVAFALVGAGFLLGLCALMPDTAAKYIMEPFRGYYVSSLYGLV